MAVYGTVGLGGKGKTLSTVARLWKKYKEGRVIWSNTPLVDLRVKYDDSMKKWVPVDPSLFGRSWAERYVYNIDDVLKARDCEILLDELGAWVPADEYRDIPKAFKRLITQDRRNGINIWWTYRHTRVWNEIRDNTVEYRYCYKYGLPGLGSVVFQRSVDAEDPKSKPVFHWYFIDANTFNLYQTYAEVGDRTGQGYGMGALASKKGAVINNWGPHKLSLSVTPAQYRVLIDCYGPEALGLPGGGEAAILGMLREVDSFGQVKYLMPGPAIPRPLA